MFWMKNHINFDEIPQKEYINFDWKEDNKKLIDFTSCKYLIIWHHQSKERNFNNLPVIPDLEYLEINWSNSICLVGLEKYKKLKRLELHYCIKLEMLDGLDNMNPKLEYLHINQSKKLLGHDKIKRFGKLRTLCFNDCGVVNDIEFVLKLEKLEDFRFVNTNVLNGDLTPIIKHDKIRSVGFLNKRHYSHKDVEIDTIIKEKV